MSETITATIVEPFPPELIESRSVPIEQLHRLREAVLSFVEQNGFDPEDTLFAGYSADVSKTPGSEHWEHGRPARFYFGGLRSLEDPQVLSADEDLQGEHWVVNPLHYAIQGGRLGVYSKVLLEDLHVGPDENDDEDTEEFSTYVYQLPDPSKLAGAQLAELTIR